MASSTSLEALASRTEKIVNSLDEDDKVKRSALAAFRRAIDVRKAMMIEDVTAYQKTLTRLESKFRADMSDAAVRDSATYASKREALLSSKSTHLRSEILGRADLLAQSKDANESLARTRNLMVKELSRLNGVNEVLLSDSERLRDVGGEYTQYGSTLKVSRDLTKNMQRREKTDRLLLGFGFLFFLLVVLYILKRRLMPFFSPIGWLVEVLASYATGNLTAAGDVTSAKAPLSGSMVSPDGVINLNPEL